MQSLTLAAASSAALGTDGREGVGRELANWGVAPKELAEGLGLGGLRSGPEGALGLLESVNGGAKGVPALQRTVMSPVNCLQYFACLHCFRHSETWTAAPPHRIANCLCCSLRLKRCCTNAGWLLLLSL